MNVSLQTYIKNRENLLGQIKTIISSDERFVAAWLTGSYSRDQQDALSDIDITIVVANEFSEILCLRLARVSSRTTPERLALFNRFGEIAILHENNNNAPHGGTFTNTIYAESALVIDWILIPHAETQRPSPSLIIFDRVGIPEVLPVTPETQEQRIEKLSEITAFFWMMLAITVKYLVRGDAVFVITWIEELHKMLREIKRLLAGESYHYKGGSTTTITTDCAAQIDNLYKLSDEMQSMMPKIVTLGGFVRPSPMPTLEKLLKFAKEKCRE